MSYNFYQKQNKYRNQKVEADGEIFDSRKEYNRYCELKLLERAGEISNLRRQEKFILIPTQREPDETGPRGGIKKGKVLERECAYFADFVYTDDEGHIVVEDTKSPVTRTEVYKIKKKLMLERHGIKIKEL